MPTTVSKEELLDLAGHETGPSSWFEIDQERVDRFADATNDHQFIHVDPEKAARTPFGGTVAHGYLSLSLVPSLAREIAVVPEKLTMAVNYGLDKVRFPQPVRVGSAVRIRSKILRVVEKKPGQILVSTETTMEIRGETKPALVAENLSMYVVR